MKKPIVSIIIPTLNEEKNIVPLLARIEKKIHISHEIIVVDDNSQDRTIQHIQTAMRKNKNITLYQRANKQGLASAFSYAFTKARGRYFILMDANLKHPPETIPHMLDQLPTYDLVKASRYVPHGGDRSPFPRRIIVALLNTLAHRILGGFHDYTSLYMAFHKDILKKTAFPTSAHHGEFIMEFLHQAQQKKLSIKEIPFIMQPRGPSKSKAKPIHLLFYLKTLIKIKENYA